MNNIKDFNRFINENVEHYKKSVYVDKSKVAEFKKELSKLGFKWDSYDEKERYSFICFGFTDTQMKALEPILKEYAEEILDY